tara:strand:- start:487 stop:627 length:141 start_codon:yes stop_codon:yes gene_type:complete
MKIDSTHGLKIDFYSGATRTSVSTVAISLLRMTSLEIMFSLSLGEA